MLQDNEGELYMTSPLTLLLKKIVFQEKGSFPPLSNCGSQFGRGGQGARVVFISSNFILFTFFNIIANG
jgi:hypothetical protein